MTQPKIVIKKVDIPAKTGTSAFTNKHFLLPAKVGGEMTMLNVRACGEPYQGNFGQGRKAWYIEVYGYGVSRRQVLVTSLYKAVIEE
jgi:hypothetical protein